MILEEGYLIGKLMIKEKELLTREAKAAFVGFLFHFFCCMGVQKM